MNFALALPSAGGVSRAIFNLPIAFVFFLRKKKSAWRAPLRDEGDIEAARQLVLSHLRVVVAIARGYKGYGLPQADLIQEGNIGLMKAVKRFDPERGVRLVSFAVHWIKAEIHEFILRNWRLVKIATTKAQRKLFFNLRSMKPALDTMNPDEINAIAKQLGVKAEEVVEMETRLGGRDISLEPLSEDDDDESFTPIAYLTDGAEPLACWRRSKSAACVEKAWNRHWPAWMNAAVISLSPAGCAKRILQRCTILRTNWAYPPSASARLKPRPCRKCG